MTNNEVKVLREMAETEYEESKALIAAGWEKAGNYHLKKSNALKEACLALERIEEQDLLLKIVFQYLTNDFEVNWEEYKEYNKYPKSLLDIRVMIDLLDLKYLNNARFRKRLGVEKFSKEVESFFRNDLKEVHTILNEKKEVLQNGK